MKTINDDLREEITQIDTIFEVIRDLDEPFEHLDWDTVREDVQTRISEAVLSIDKTTNITVMLGCGGPTRYFEIEFDSEGDAVRGKYINTYFDGFQRDKDGNEVKSATEISLSDDEVDLIVQRYSLDTMLKKAV